MDLLSVVDGLPSNGLEAMARKLLEPLREESAGSLVETLRAYLHHSGNTRAVCEELFIHRNTLSYRLRRIEELLGANLSDGRLRAVLLLALAITEPGGTAG
jgi:PucR family transcriptional regulator, purine catabolism regulatory protein